MNIRQSVALSILGAVAVGGCGDDTSSGATSSAGGGGDAATSTTASNGTSSAGLSSSGTDSTSSTGAGGDGGAGVGGEGGAGTGGDGTGGDGTGGAGGSGAGGGGFASCPPGSETIDHAWGGDLGDAVDSRGFGDNILSIRFTIPEGTTITSSKLISLVEFVDGPTTREMVLSTAACDFSEGLAAKSSTGAAAHAINTSPAFSYRTEPGPTYVGVTPGTPYFVNVRNRDAQGNDTCAASCNVRVTIRD